MLPTWQLILADATLTLLSVVLGLMIRLEIIYVGYFVRAIWPFIVLAMLLRPLVFYLMSMYKRIWQYAAKRDFFNLAISILIGTAILSLVTMLWLYPRWLGTFPRSLLILEGGISLILLGGFRIGLNVFERSPGDINWKKAKWPSLKRTLIVGAGSAGTLMLKELLTNPQFGLKPIALLDDDTNKIGYKVQGLKVFGPLIRLPDIADKLDIEEVVIALPSAPAQKIQNLKSICQKNKIHYSTMPSLGSIFGETAYPDSRFQIPMSMPDIGAEEIQAVVRVMQSRNLSIGSQTIALEELAANVANAAYGVAVTNGTNGLHLSMIAAGVGQNDEVITSPYSFIASANCILYERARPVFVDIDPVTLNIDPAKIEAAITERTRAIIPVHVFGQPANMDPILEIAERYNLKVIEDAAEAIGASYKGRRVGALGEAGVFAFYPNKQMTTGEGAVLVTNNEEWANLFRSLRNQGRDQFNEWLHHSRLGYNYRMSELNSSVGVVQMRRLDEMLRKREAVALEYSRHINQMYSVNPIPIVPSTTRMSWFVYVVRFLPTIDRNQVMANLAERGIPSRPYFSPIHLQPFYREQFGFKPGDFPESEAAGKSTLALPFHTNMNTDEIRVVCDALREAINVV